MKRILCWLLVSFFFVYTAEVPFELFRGKPLSTGCCCKASVVCRCKHTDRICRLNKHLPLNAQPAFSALNALKCGFPEDKSVSSSYPKEFDLISYTGIFPREMFGPLFLNKAQGFILLLDRRLDRPPRFTPAFSL